MPGVARYFFVPRYNEKMKHPELHIRHARLSDLDSINLVIEAAINTWDLPQRVIRLSLSSYRYHAIDYQHLEIQVVEMGSEIVGVAAWEAADSSDTPGQQAGLLLHGLYVDPQMKKRGIGQMLLHRALQAALSGGYQGLLVKAQSDAMPFFLKAGMQALEVDNQQRDYANRLWKAVN